MALALTSWSCMIARGGYEGSIRWFELSGSSVSAHYVVREDGCEATQMVDLADNAWQACTFNRRSVGIEMSGFASRGFDALLLATTARVFAFLCYHLQIPIRHARAGIGPGIASHDDLGALGGGHHDPSEDPASCRDSSAWLTTSIVSAISPKCGIHTGHRRRVCYLLIAARCCRPRRCRRCRTFTRSVDFNRGSGCSPIVLPSMATTVPKPDGRLRVSRCAPESSLMELPAHRRKQSYSAS
jgi:N-acetylmuramoyl-L-alanine amidase